MVDKYIQPDPATPFRKQDVIGVEVARLMTSGGVTIPVAVTTEEDRITVCWWDAANSRWQFHVRSHDTALPANEGRMAFVSSWDWSNRAAVACVTDQVFIAYKRTVRIPGRQTEIFLDRFIWNASTSTLDFDTAAAPIAVPVRGLGFLRAGYWISLGSEAASNKLRLLLQTFRFDQRIVVPPGSSFDFLDPRLFDPRLRELGIPLGELARELEHRNRLQGPIRIGYEPAELTLFSADVSNPAANLAAAASWRTAKIDDGGYDFDARIDGSKLWCVCRQTEYALHLVTPVVANEQDIALAPPTFDPVASYGGQRLTQVDLAAMGTPVLSQEDLPGGDNPHIQTISPFLITCDRVAAGKFFVRFAPDGTTRIVRAAVDAFDKWILAKVGGLPFTAARLMQFPGNIIPRNLVDADRSWTRPLWRDHVDRNDVYFSSLASHMPVVVTAVSFRNSNKAIIDVDLLRHDVPLGSLGVSRFVVDTGAGTAIHSGFAIVDINHGIAIPGLTPSATADNGQFIPVDTGPNDPVPTQRVDTTIGGALISDRAKPGLDFYAYTDLGDAGCRVFYASNVEPPDPSQHPVTKLFQSNAVVATGNPADVDIVLLQATFAPSPIPYQAIGFQSGTLCPGVVGYRLNTGAPQTVETRSPISSLCCTLDVVSSFVLGGPLLAGMTVTIREGDADILQDLGSLTSITMDVWDTLWDPITRVNEDLQDSNVEFFDTTLKIAQYTIRYFFTVGATRGRDRIEITAENAVASEYMFRGGQGQGFVDYRFRIELENKDNKWGLTTYTLDKVKVAFFYMRRFTPGILMREEHRRNPLSPAVLLTTPLELVSDHAAGLCMKPADNASVSVDAIKVKVSPTATFGAVIADAGLAALGAMMLTALVLKIAGWLGLIASASTIPIWGWVLAAILFAALMLFLFFGVPPIIENAIESRVEERIEDPDSTIVAGLGNANLMTYAGPALAEEIARRALATLADPARPVDAAGHRGLNRFQGQFWQRIFICDGRCEIKVR